MTAANSNTDVAMIIDGERVGAGEFIDIINPATGEVFAQAPRAGQVELDRAVAAAQGAFPGWKATPYDERRRLLAAAAKIIMANVDELARLFTLEQGRPLAFAREEVMGAAMWLRGMGMHELPVEVTGLRYTGSHWVWCVPSCLGIFLCCWRSGKFLMACSQATPWCLSLRHLLQ